jgi:molybdenum cofactor cytidylyltransferase
MDVGAAVPDVAGVVLAAGSSTRMGHNKLLLRLEGESLVRRSVARALEAGLDPVLVVTGFEAQAVAAELAGLPCRAVYNPDHLGGIGGSMRLGIAHAPATARAAVVLLADMPFVSAAMIRALVQRHATDGAALVASRYGEVVAPPTLYGASLFAEFQSLPADGCGRQLIRRHWDEACFLSWPAEALADVDRPEDFERLTGRRLAG